MAKRTNLEITAEILSLCRMRASTCSVTKYATKQKGLKFIEKWREIVALL